MPYSPPLSVSYSREGSGIMDVLKKAYQNGVGICAETVGAEKTIGPVEVGKRADILLLKENPLDHIGTLKDPLYVIKAGVVLFD